jgi:hypothetical protein
MPIPFEVSDGVRPGTWLARTSTLVASVALVAWLCGNAYEEVVIVPNLAFGDARAAMVAFRTFFHVSNPVFFYVPIGPAVVVSSIANVVVSWREPARRKTAVGAAACVGLGFALTAWIVVHVNLHLFFGPTIDDSLEAQSLARQWLALNAVRMLVVVVAIGLVRRLDAPPRSPAGARI